MSKAAGRAGRLAEAMTRLRRVLAETRRAAVAADGVSASTGASDTRGNVQSLGHGSALTTALLGARWPADGFAKELSGGSAVIEIPDAMRGFLGQVGQLGSRQRAPRGRQQLTARQKRRRYGGEELAAVQVNGLGGDL